VYGFMGKGLSYGLQARDGDQVMVCLKRALKIAHAAQQQLAVARRQSDSLPAALFVEILNHYLYYFDQGLTLISSTVLQVNIPLHM
jgi:vacuolar protein sorting-associated protein 35